MPILVKWKWKEKTKSFLVIFYFYDDRSVSNLRFGIIKFKRDDKDIITPMMNWAPSHVELGYLGEVLRYANIIDGLSETEKKNLRIDLEYSMADQNRLGPRERVELCSEYIDYLKEVLKPCL